MDLISVLKHQENNGGINFVPQDESEGEIIDNQGRS